MSEGSSPVRPEQLVFDLPHRQALAREDFLVSGSNAAAVALVDGWPDWPTHTAIVVGPAGSGKTHLSTVWRLRSGADALSASEIDDGAVRRLEAAGALAIEDIDKGIADERVFFHLLNLARQQGHSVLATSRVPPGDLEIALPDLRSRLRALPMVLIEEPDDGVLKAVLVKLFQDRQLLVDPHVIGHLALHMERSLAAAQRIVERCDTLALAQRRKVTRALAAEALAEEAQEAQEARRSAAAGGTSLS